MVLKISLCILTLTVLASSDDYSGLFSRLYKKASNEKRPLILVLDNSLKEDATHAPQAPRDVNVDIDSDVPLNLLELLNVKRHPVKHEHQHQSIISILADNNDAEQSSNNGELEASFVQSDLQRLRDRLEKERERRRENRKRKERRERRERRQRLNRVQFKDDDGKHDRDDDNQQHRDENRSQSRAKEAQQNRSQDRQQNRNQNRNRQRQQDRNRVRNRNIQQQRNQDRNLQRQQDNQDRDVQRQQDRNQDSNPFLDKKKTLRSSVIKNLLRTYNNLNCEAKDECQDECSKLNGKKQDKCEDKCEVKYECEESEPEDDCKKGECEDSDEFGSTKGERLVTVTEKCKRC